MSNNFQYIEAYHSELEYYQIICLSPLIKEYYHIHYDLTCALANFINQYSDLCIFKIFNAESKKKQEQERAQTQQGEQQPLQVQPEQQEQQDEENCIWKLYTHKIEEQEKVKSEKVEQEKVKQEKVEQEKVKQEKVEEGKVCNKSEILQCHMQGFKEQLFIKFSFLDIQQKGGYLNKCEKIIQYIEDKQKKIMNENSDTQNLEEEIANFIEQKLDKN